MFTAAFLHVIFVVRTEMVLVWKGLQFEVVMALSWLDGEWVESGISTAICFCELPARSSVSCERGWTDSCLSTAFSLFP